MYKIYTINSEQFDVNSHLEQLISVQFDVGGLSCDAYLSDSVKF
jgi:hypothetical protein